MLKPSGRVILPCACGCCNLVFEKDEFMGGETFFSVSVQDSRYDHKVGGAWNRIKGAAKVLFGKPVYYNDVYIENKAEFSNLIDDLAELLES